MAKMHKIKQAAGMTGLTDAMLVTKMIGLAGIS
jgi:hypothetical protein